MAIPSGYTFPDLNGFVRAHDFAAFARSYPVAACKVSEGASFGSSGPPGSSDYWPEFLADCRRYGVFPIGYHFLRREIAIDVQVGNFLRRLDGGPVGIMLDIETSGAHTNPTMGQADQWFDLVSARIGRPRAAMLSYLPRQWWLDFGGGSLALADTIGWNAHYSSNPYVGPYAGWDAPTIIQFSSTTAGSGMPPGDMNIAINMTAAELKAALMGEDDMPTAEEVAKAVHDLLWKQVKAADPPVAQLDLGHMLAATYNKAGDLQTKVGFLTAATGQRFDAIDGAVEAVKKTADALELDVEGVRGLLTGLTFNLDEAQMTQLVASIAAGFPQLSTAAIADAVAHRFGEALR